MLIAYRDGRTDGRTDGGSRTYVRTHSDEAGWKKKKKKKTATIATGPLKLLFIEGGHSQL